jgi:hypothetical protein
VLVPERAREDRERADIAEPRQAVGRPRSDGHVGVAHGVEEVAFLALARRHREAARRLLADVGVVVLRRSVAKYFTSRDEPSVASDDEARCRRGPRTFSGISLKSALSARSARIGSMICSSCRVARSSAARTRRSRKLPWRPA